MVSAEPASASHEFAASLVARLRVADPAVSPVRSNAGSCPSVGVRPCFASSLAGSCYLPGIGVLYLYV